MEAATSAPAEKAPCRSPAPLLAGLGRVAVRRLGEALEPAGIKPRHLNLLLSLRAGPTTQQGLADAIGVDAVQLVGLLNDLEGEGLVERRRDPIDRRRHIVQLSCAGERRLIALDAAVAEVEDDLLAALDPTERAQFHRYLARVADSAEEAGVPPPELAAPCPSEA